MNLNNIFAKNEILGASMVGAQFRNNVINHNIANVDVPGFRRGVVEFENLLLREIETAERNDRRANFNAISPELHISHHVLPHRNDGNNVDIELEMVALYQNSTRFEVMSSSLINNYNRLNVALNSNI